MPVKQIKHMEVILKTVERCNINCTYCYFFNGIDQSYLKHPPYIKHETISQTADFLARGCTDFHIPSVRIDLHGGEPLMQKQQDFQFMCETFIEKLSPHTNLSFSIQTNGMLITDPWLEILAKYKVHIGISLDGPKSYNDQFRIDKRGRGTYDRVVDGIKLAQHYSRTYGIPEPAILSVVNPEFSGKDIYRHFVDELGFRNLDFLIPDITHDAAKKMKAFNSVPYGEFLSSILSEWVKDDNPEIFIRILNSTFSLFLGGDTQLIGYGDDGYETLAYTIASNGAIAPDDTLRSTDPSFMNTTLNVFNHSLADFIEHPIMRLLQKNAHSLPSLCQSCKWRQVCGGGFMVNRYSSEQQFQNPSVMCAGLKNFYQNVHEYFVQHGAAAELVC